MGEIQTISSPSSREILYSRHADCTDNITYFFAVQYFIIPYGRFRNLICHLLRMFFKLQIMVLEWGGAYQRMIFVHVRKSS
jgi:hypothetical protein